MPVPGRGVEKEPPDHPMLGMLIKVLYLVSPAGLKSLRCDQNNTFYLRFGLLYLSSCSPAKKLRGSCYPMA